MITSEATTAFSVPLTVGSQDLGGDLTLPEDAPLRTLAAVLGVPVHDHLGHVVVLTERPPSADLSGESFALIAEDGSSPPPPRYSEDLEATATDLSGRALFLNVLPGRYTLTSPIIDRCTVVSGWAAAGASSTRLAIHPGTVTVLLLSGCR